MQPLPRHWATVRETHTFPRSGTCHLAVNGWSDRSVEDARRDARERMDRLVAAGGPGRWDAHGSEYYPSRRLPEELLDEVHDAEGTLIAAVTRNRYGAAVLNTDSLLISDIDMPAERSRRPRPARPGLLARLFGRGTEPGDPSEGAPSEDPDLLGRRGSGERGQAHDRILGVIHRFAARHPELGVRAYRTRGGFRLLVSGSAAHPASDRARALMEELDSDRLYVTLCRVHDTYRARLTPKPWRLGMDAFEALGTGTSTGAAHRDWVRRYEDAAAHVAVCRLLEVSGPAPSTREQRIIALHDTATGAGSGRRLA